MESTTLDQLSRPLATTPGRRGVFADLAGALSALLSRRDPTEGTIGSRGCRPLHRSCFPERGLDRYRETYYVASGVP